MPIETARITADSGGRNLLPYLEGSIVERHIRVKNAGANTVYIGNVDLDSSVLGLDGGGFPISPGEMVTVPASAASDRLQTCVNTLGGTSLVCAFYERTGPVYS